MLKLCVFPIALHVGLLQRVGFKAAYLIVQPAIEGLYNASNALKLYMHPVIWALWGHAEAKIMHQYCNIQPTHSMHVYSLTPNRESSTMRKGKVYEP